MQKLFVETISPNYTIWILFKKNIFYIVTLSPLLLVTSSYTKIVPAENMNQLSNGNWLSTLVLGITNYYITPWKLSKLYFAAAQTKWNIFSCIELGLIQPQQNAIRRYQQLIISENRVAQTGKQSTGVGERNN